MHFIIVKIFNEIEKMCLLLIIKKCYWRIFVQFDAEISNHIMTQFSDLFP